MAYRHGKISKKGIPASKVKAGQGKGAPVVARQVFPLWKRNPKAGALFRLVLMAHRCVPGQALQVLVARKVVFQGRQIHSAVGAITDGFTEQGEEEPAWGPVWRSAPPTVQRGVVFDGQPERTETDGRACGSLHELPSIHSCSSGCGGRKKTFWRSAP